MTVIIGIITVFVCVIGGYVLEHGNVSVLIQPTEVLIIVGAMVGSFIISAPMKLVKEVAFGVLELFKPSKDSAEGYIKLLALLNDMLTKITKEGLLSMEQELLAKKENSPLMTKYPEIASKKHVVRFLCNSLSIIIDSDISGDALDDLLGIEIETFEHEVMEVPHSVDKIADGLPGLGIVAAVLGVVITMGKIDESPEVLGESIGAALLGTFLGVLLCYGFVGPMGTHLTHKAKGEVVYLKIIKIALVSFLKGSPVRMALEFAKRTIPSHALEHEKKEEKKE